jgi:hypothetical protein
MSQGGMRDTLRLAGTVMVVNGFASLTGLAFATYASLAVLSVTVGSYGNTLELGRQRLIGTLLGAIVVFFGYRAWGQLPVLVALPLALLLVRALAGWLRLTVGYGVSCFVVIMGWLSHEQQLDSWITLRLFWTAFGILLALLSLRLFWPSRARMQQRLGLLQLLVDLGNTMQCFVGRQPQQHQRRAFGEQLRGLRSDLLSLRDQRQSALLELGSLAAQHPVARLWELLDQTCETLILDLDELRRLPTPHWQSWGLELHHEAALQFSGAVAERLAHLLVVPRRHLLEHVEGLEARGDAHLHTGQVSQRRTNASIVEQPLRIGDLRCRELQPQLRRLVHHREEQLVPMHPGARLRLQGKKLHGSDIALIVVLPGAVEDLVCSIGHGVSVAGATRSWKPLPSQKCAADLMNGSPEGGFTSRSAGHPSLCRVQEPEIGLAGEAGLVECVHGADVLREHVRIPLLPG